MNKRTVSLLLPALAIAANAAFSQDQRKKRIAIFDFDYATVHSGVAAIFGQDVDVGRGVSDLLVSALVKYGTYSVIERNALNKILAEQNFSNSDRAEPPRPRGSPRCCLSCRSSPMNCRTRDGMVSGSVTPLIVKSQF
jgi:curli biogenesis system outer membrane secretion channel CsgG